MEAGTLRSRVAIERISTEQDEIGQPVTTWTTFAEVWANILHRSGAEAIRGGQDASVVQASIRIRRRPGVTAGMRVRHGTVIYAIKAVLPDEVVRDHIDLVSEQVNG